MTALKKMSTFFFCILLLGLSLSSACGTKQGDALKEISNSLEGYLNKHVRAMRFPTIEELNVDMVTRYYTSHELRDHPSYLEGDFNHDEFPDHAFIIPLESGNSVCLIVNSKPRKKQPKDADEISYDYKLFFFGLNGTFTDDFLEFKNNEVIRHSQDSNAVHFKWDQDQQKYIQKGNLVKLLKP